jgi:hypothetical protein
MRRLAILLAVPAALSALTCGDSAISIRVLFPDQQQLQLARRIEVTAVEPRPGQDTCAAILGRRASQLGEVLATRTVSLPLSPDQEVSLKELPMRPMMISALAHDASYKVFLAGCAKVDAEPGDSVTVTVKLLPCPGGSCLGCDAKAPDCPPGLDCKDGVCTCSAGGSCDGCCQPGSNTCAPGTSTSACGKDGAACEVCPSAGDPCRVTACQDGECLSTPRADGTSCSGGRCQSGACCKGCWDPTSKSCEPGTDLAACGRSGETCDDCTTTDPCRSPSCSSGNCYTGAQKPDGAACPGGACWQGTCCTGCLTSFTCQPGTTDTVCGTSGATCVDCTTLTTDCKTGTCVSGKCQSVNQADGTGCQSGDGQCRSGGCCTGCWDAGASICLPGTANSACGADGDPCVDCAQSSQTCDGGTGQCE